MKRQLYRNNLICSWMTLLIPYFLQLRVQEKLNQILPPFSYFRKFHSDVTVKSVIIVFVVVIIGKIWFLLPPLSLLIYFFSISFSPWNVILGGWPSFSFVPSTEPAFNHQPPNRPPSSHPPALLTSTSSLLSIGDHKSTPQPVADSQAPSTQQKAKMWNPHPDYWSQYLQPPHQPRPRSNVSSYSRRQR